MANEPGLRRAIQALAEEERRLLSDHPMPDELVDYQADDVTAEERERIQAHLALCPACAQAVLDVEPLPEARLSDRTVAAAWARFRGRRRAAVWPWSLAAALLLAVFGLAFELSLLRREIAAPRAGLQIVDLFPAGEDVQRSAGGGDVVQAPAWVDHLVLILNLTQEPMLPVYSFRITEVGGQEVWRGADLRPGADGALTLEVPRRLLPAGEYRIGLSGSGAPVAEYTLHLQE
jgi:Putative zinc-finger